MYILFVIYTINNYSINFYFQYFDYILYIDDPTI